MSMYFVLSSILVKMCRSVHGAWINGYVKQDIEFEDGCLLGC
jgi:hypothetical protein